MTRWFFLIPFSVGAGAFAARGPCSARSTNSTGSSRFRCCPECFCGPGSSPGCRSSCSSRRRRRHRAARSDRISRVPGRGVPALQWLVLPHGGALFRLCGIYDEPGTVGTIAALCLARTRFRLRSVPGRDCLAAGMMSLSIAFAVLTSRPGPCRHRQHRQAAAPGYSPRCSARLRAALPLSGLKFGDPTARITIVVLRVARPLRPAAPRRRA